MKKMILALALVASVTTTTTSQAGIYLASKNVLNISKPQAVLAATSYAMGTFLSFGTLALPIAPLIFTSVMILGDDSSSTAVQFKQVTLEDAHKAGVSEVALSEYNDNVDTLNMINEHVEEKVISGEISSKEKVATLYNELAQEFELDLSVTKTAVQLVTGEK